MIRQGVLVFDDASCVPSTLRVAGLSLLERGILTMARAGLERVLVVLPAGVVPPRTRPLRRLQAEVEFTTWGAAPFQSLPADEDWLLLRADHVHHHSSLTALLQSGLHGAQCLAQVSPPPARSASPAQLPDVDDAAASAADLGVPRRVSTGAFLCSRRLGGPTAATLAATDTESRVASCLQGGPTVVIPGSPTSWCRVRDRGDARAARDMLFEHVRKSTSGVVARALNTRMSIPLSRLLVDTGITPNMVTLGLVLSTGLLAAFLISEPVSYGRILAAGICWQLASILDGCDGEIARVKLCESQLGAWVDTVTDNVAYVALTGGIFLGMMRLHPGWQMPQYAGLSAAGCLLLALALMYRYAIRTGHGSLQYYEQDLAARGAAAQTTGLYRLFQRYGLFVRHSHVSRRTHPGLRTRPVLAAFATLKERP